jgi:type III pantothenate kinase
MILAINIGNTNLWLGLQVESRIISSRTSTKNCNTSQDIEQIILTFLMEQGFSSQEISGCIISSVVPKKIILVTEAIRSLISINPVLITSEMDYGIDISYDKTLLGTDRLLCCMSAALRFGLPIIVYDLGTATTANIVTKDRIFLGGAILPGVDTGLKALVNSTAMLPSVIPATSVPLIGSDTNECLLSGAIYGTASFIDDYTDRINTELGGKVTVIITGGNAPRIMPYLKTEFDYCPNLLLEGMFLLYLKLTQGKVN